MTPASELLAKRIILALTTRVKAEVLSEGLPPELVKQIMADRQAIADRYGELRIRQGFIEAEFMAATEWLARLL